MALGELRKGKDLITRTAEGSSRVKRTSFISWKDGDTKSVYFITPIDEVPKVMMHNFVKKIVDTDEGGKRDTWLTFMCRKDPAWREESGGFCPLCDDIGHAATERFVALAVEVDPVLEGRKVTDVKIKYKEGKDHEGNEVQYPQVGLVIQSAKIFFKTLVALDQKGRDVNGISWDVTREGAGFNTNYLFYPIEAKPDLEPIDDYIVSLESILDSLGSVEKYEELDGVRAEDQPSFGGVSSNSKKDDDTSEVFNDLKESLRKQKKEKVPTESY